MIKKKMEHILVLYVSAVDAPIQHYVIKFVSDLRHTVVFLRVLRSPHHPPIKPTTTI